MRYLVETENELMLKNIKINNKCKISSLGPSEAVFEVEEAFNLFKIKCGGCGEITFTDKMINYCPMCGARRVEHEPDTSISAA